MRITSRFDWNFRKTFRCKKKQSHGILEKCGSVAKLLKQRSQRKVPMFQNSIPMQLRGSSCFFSFASWHLKFSQVANDQSGKTGHTWHCPEVSWQAVSIPLCWRPMQGGLAAVNKFERWSIYDLKVMKENDAENLYDLAVSSTQNQKSSLISGSLKNHEHHDVCSIVQFFFWLFSEKNPPTWSQRFTEEKVFNRLPTKIFPTSF